MQGWNNLEANAKPIINEMIYQDGKGVLVNLPIPGVKQIYWMHAEELPERILITDIAKMYQENFEIYSKDKTLFSLKEVAAKKKA